MKVCSPTLLHIANMMIFMIAEDITRRRKINERDATMRASVQSIHCFRLVTEYVGKYCNAAGIYYRTGT